MISGSRQSLRSIDPYANTKDLFLGAIWFHHLLKGDKINFQLVSWHILLFRKTFSLSVSVLHLKYSSVYFVFSQNIRNTVVF